MKNKLGPFGGFDDLQEIERDRDFFLDLFTTIPVLDARISFARNPTIPPVTAETLAKDSNKESTRIKLAIAGNPAAPVDLLESFSKSEKLYSRVVVARNPSTPSYLLLKIRKEAHPEVILALCENENLPEPLMMDLSQTENQTIWEFLASRQVGQRIPTELLDKFLGSENVNVLHGLARNPTMTANVLERLADLDHEPVVIEAVASNPATPRGSLIKIHDGSQIKIYEIHKIISMALARNISTPGHVLDQLSLVTANKGLLGNLARNTGTPEYILKKLATAKTRIVRFNVAANPSAPMEVIEKLAKDSIAAVSANAAKNTSATVEFLRELAKSGHEETVVNVASNPSTPLDVLEHFAHAILLGGRRNAFLINLNMALINNPSTPLPLLRSLLPDISEANANILAAIARNIKLTW